MTPCYDFEKHIMITFVMVATVLMISVILLVGNKASGQVPIPLGQCATMLETGTVIVDLTCPNHTQTIKLLLEEFGYMIMLETATEMNLQPTTDTIDILKERGIDLNYTLTPP